MDEDLQSHIACLKRVLFNLAKYDPKIEPTEGQLKFLNQVRILESLTQSEQKDLENRILPSNARALELCNLLGVDFIEYERTLNSFVFDLPRVKKEVESFSEAYIADLKHSAQYWTLNPDHEGSPRSEDQVRILESLSSEENEALTRGVYPASARRHEICERLNIKTEVYDETLRYFAHCAQIFQKSGLVSHIMSTNDGPMFEAIAKLMREKGADAGA